MGAHHDQLRLIADMLFGAGANAAAPGTWYVGASTTTPNKDGTGATEPSGGGYGRVPLTNNTTNWPAATTSASGDTTKVNAVKATFPNPTGNWGVITHLLIFAAASGGTPRFSKELDQPISARAGNTPVEFDAGAIVLPFS